MPPQSATPKMRSPPTEKRLLRYRSSCPSKLLDRIQRASTQRLYLIQRTDVNPHDAMFTVLGSTGNVYEVALSHIPSCSCPDFARNQDLCKHILFVTNKVVGLHMDNPLMYQRAYLTSELDQIFGMIRNRQVGGAVLANERVRESFAKATSPGKSGSDLPCEDDKNSRRRSLDEDADCPICFDPMSDINETTFCREVCGANFHKDCIRRWLSQQRGQPTCPNCRSIWHSTGEATSSSATATSNTIREGYLNFGALQGQSSVRDTSTYNEYGYSYGRSYKRRRYGRY